MKTLVETILSRKLHDPKVIIYKWLDEYGIKNYTVNDKGEIDVDGDVDLSECDLTELPSFIQFGTVKENFDCSYNSLTTLEGSPREVGKDFYCYENKLKILDGSPEKVGRDFYCHNNNLTTLEGSPREVGGSFYCYNSNLKDLKGSPKVVKEDFDCSHNDLTTLKGAPKEVGGYLNCSYNSTKFTEDDVRKVCKVKKGIIVK